LIRVQECRGERPCFTQLRKDYGPDRGNDYRTDPAEGNSPGCAEQPR